MYIKLEESEVKKILLVYKSRTGLTKQYAEWIAEEIDMAQVRLFYHHMIIPVRNISTH